MIPTKHMSMTFIKKILSGEKLLLTDSQVNRIRNIPSYQELSTGKIWEMLNNLPERDLVIRYFPEYIFLFLFLYFNFSSFNDNKLPPKEYLCDVLNSLIPDMVTKVC